MGVESVGGIGYSEEEEKGRRCKIRDVGVERCGEEVKGRKVERRRREKGGLGE